MAYLPIEANVINTKVNPEHEVRIMAEVHKPSKQGQVPLEPPVKGGQDPVATKAVLIHQENNKARAVCFGKHEWLAPSIAQSRVWHFPSDNLFRRPRYLLNMPSDKSRPLSSNLCKKATRHKKRTLMPNQRNYRTTEYQISSIEKLQNLFYISSIQSQLQNQRPRTISNIFYLSAYGVQLIRFQPHPKFHHRPVSEPTYFANRNLKPSPSRHFHTPRMFAFQNPYQNLRLFFA